MDRLAKIAERVAGPWRIKSGWYNELGVPTIWVKARTAGGLETSMMPKMIAEAERQAEKLVKKVGFRGPTMKGDYVIAEGGKLAVTVARGLMGFELDQVESEMGTMSAP
jgi:hypothetical protein